MPDLVSAPIGALGRWGEETGTEWMDAVRAPTKGKGRGKAGKGEDKGKDDKGKDKVVHCHTGPWSTQAKRLKYETSIDNPFSKYMKLTYSHV